MRIKSPPVLLIFIFAMTFMLGSPAAFAIDGAAVSEAIEGAAGGVGAAGTSGGGGSGIINPNVNSPNGEGVTDGLTNIGTNAENTFGPDGAGGGTGSGGTNAAGYQPNQALKELNKVCGKDAFSFDTSKQLKVVSGMTACFNSIIDKMAVTNIVKMSDYLGNTVATILVLYVMFFGVKLALAITTEQKAKGELVIGGLKIGFISWLLFNYGVIDLWYMVLDVYAGLVGIVLSLPDVEGCETAAVQGLDQVWSSMDCLLSQFLGWGVENKNGSKETPLLFGFFNSLFHQGLSGGLVALVILFTMFNVFLAFYRIVFIYISSMVGLVLLFAIAPLTIPMILFQPTKSYFESWMRMVISFILQPVLLFAFLGFAIVMFQEMITGENGLTEVMGRTNITGQTAETTQTGTNTRNLMAWQMLDPENIIGDMKQLSYSLLSIMVTAYILLTFSNFVDDLAHELSGASAPRLSSFTPKIMGMG